MRKLSLAAAAVCISSCTLFAGLAKAETFALTATGSGFLATATLTGSPDTAVAGAFDITAGTGIWNGVAFTLIPGGNATTPAFAAFGAPEFTYESNYTYNNVVYLSGNGGSPLDDYGLLFQLGDDHLNLIAGPAYANDEILNGFSTPLDTLTITDTGTGVTPEPSSIALLGTGLLGTVGLLRRRYAA